MDIGELWLRENDPLYDKTEQRARLPHPYLTARQEKVRARLEIPVSSLWYCREKLNLSDNDARQIIEQLK